MFGNVLIILILTDLSFLLALCPDADEEPQGRAGHKVQETPSLHHYCPAAAAVHR